MNTINSTNPKVSVIIPTYNAGQYIKDAIKSALNQTYKNIEIIVVDDGSIDDTGEVVKNYEIKYLRKANGGPASARNVGIKEARGEYIAFLDADDLWLPEKLQEQIDFAANNKSMGLVHSDVITKYSNGETKIKRKGKDNYCRNEFYNLFMGNFITNSSVLAPKRHFEVFGSFDESPDLIANEDYDMWLRIASKHDIAYINKPLVVYRIHDQGISRDPKRAYLGEKRVIERNLVNFGKDFPKIERLYRKRMSKLFFNFGYEYFSNSHFNEARTQFLTSLSYQPWNIKTLKYYIATFFDAKAINFIMEFKRKMRIFSKALCTH